MEELVNQVSQRTGLPHDQARIAVQVVLDYLKTKLPAPLAGQLDALVAGNAGNLGNLAQGLGGLGGIRPSAGGAGGADATRRDVDEER